MNRASSATGWVKNPDGSLGWTWNPLTGCLNNCSYCYARKLANGRLKSRYLANDEIATTEEALFHQLFVMTDPFYPRFWEDRLDIILPTLAKHRGIFVCDMSDLFGIGIPEEWTIKVLDYIRWCSQHRFYLLTKQPQNLIKFSPFPENCWVGVTATNQVMWNESLRYLTDIKASVKYLSVEPYLERIVPEYTLMLKSGINQVIIGAQTKPYKPPKIEWVEEIVRACDKAGIPVFLKNNLAKAIPFFKEPFCQYGMSEDGIKTVALRQELPDATKET